MNLQQRLAVYKKKAAESKSEYYQDWRKCRFAYKPVELRKPVITYNSEKKMWFCDKFENFAGELVGDAHEIVRLDHTGWYEDNFQHGLIVGAVVKVKAKKAKNADENGYVYYPATYGTNFDGVTIYNDEFDCPRDAAYRADRNAELDAEVCREEDAKWQAEQQIEDLKQELHDMNKETLAVIKELKSLSNSLPSAICKTVRMHIEDVVEKREEIFTKIEKLQDNYWLAVENW